MLRLAHRTDHADFVAPRPPAGDPPPQPWRDEKRGFSRLLMFRLNVDSVAHRRHDDGRSSGPPLTPPSKGGVRVRNECGGKPALVTMKVFNGPPQPSPTRGEGFLGLGTCGLGTRLRNKNTCDHRGQFGRSTPTFRQPSLALPGLTPDVASVSKDDFVGPVACLSETSG
jgi:hypothetical protein